MMFIVPVPAWAALVIGLLLSQVKMKGFDALSTYVDPVLKLSVIFLGFGMDFTYAYHVLSPNIWLISITAVAVFVGGYAISRLFGLRSELGLLIAAGTAICGGSAIAAVSGAIRAERHDVSIALACVFILNGMAVILFPTLGHVFELDQEMFGQWAAIAIHDTSSVLAATEQFGDISLKIGTTLKLARSLWIIPIVLVISLGKHGKLSKLKIPHFIVLFIVAMLARTILPGWEDVFQVIYEIGKRGMTVALFMIGTTLSVRRLMVSGKRPFLFSTLLWILVSACVLLILRA